ncbi:hypothetical protein ACFC09_00185 [Streptomyces sp. NPDC056161]|uniref:hypothetical protein n=1 Tax=Streptomyces sp. NPDC056161 TaxID=3345732 RepID=UPI0035DE0E81
MAVRGGRLGAGIEHCLELLMFVFGERGRGARFLLVVKDYQPGLSKELRSLPWKEATNRHAERDAGRGGVNCDRHPPPGRAPQHRRLSGTRPTPGPDLIGLP